MLDLVDRSPLALNQTAKRIDGVPPPSNRANGTGFKGLGWNSIIDSDRGYERGRIRTIEIAAQSIIANDRDDILNFDNFDKFRSCDDFRFTSRNRSGNSILFVQNTLIGSHSNGYYNGIRSMDPFDNYENMKRILGSEIFKLQGSRVGFDEGDR